MTPATRHVVKMPTHGAWFYVFVYDTAEELKTAGSKHSGEEFGNTIGLWQPAGPWGDREANLAECYWKPGGYIGTMRLCPDSMHVYHIMHECLHAAVTLTERQCYEKDGTCEAFIDLRDMESQEWFIHLHGEITDRTLGALGFPSIGGPRNVITE